MRLRRRRDRRRDHRRLYDHLRHYKITKERDPAKYEAVKQNVLDFLYCICEEEKTTPPSSLNIKEGAENYLRRGGLSDDEIARIEAGIR